MNIFYLHSDPIKAAQIQYNKHVVKMILESAQMLCTAHHHYGAGDNVPYKGELKDDTLYKHGLKKNILHTLIEVRNDLINTEIKVNKMSQFIVSSLKTINKELSL